MWNSVRVRLTLWNMAVLALVLGGFGAAFGYAVQANQSAAIDRELAGRVHRMVAWTEMMWGNAPLPQPGGRGDRTWGPNRPDRRPRQRADARPGGPGSGRSSDAEAERQGHIRRPRLLDLNGRGLGWWNEDRPWDEGLFMGSLAGEEGFTTIVAEGERLRVLSVPVRHDDLVVAVVQSAHPLGEMDRLLESQVRTLLMLIPAALLAAGLGGLFLTNRMLRPVRRVTQAAAQIGAEDLSRRLEVSGKDELSELASTFNGMIARLEGAFVGLAEAYHKLEQAYEQQRRFTGDASHELRTPLARIKASTSLALSGPPSLEEYREALAVADTAADSMGRIVQDLLLLARSDAGQLSLRVAPTPIQAVCRRALDVLPMAETAPVRLDLPAEELAVNGDADYLTRLVANLLENAVRHTPPDGQVRVSASQEADEVVLTVADTGEGIPPEHLPHVCERFYRVDAARSRGQGGTGLGLAICRSIVDAHGGSLSLRSRPGEGTVVEARLPRALAPA